jgi:hypothetical protein
LALALLVVLDITTEAQEATLFLSPRHLVVEAMVALEETIPHRLLVGTVDQEVVVEAVAGNLAVQEHQAKATTVEPQ